MSIATKNVTADVQEEGGLVERQVAVAGQEIPPAYEDLVPDDAKTTDRAALAAVQPGQHADPQHGFGPSHEATVANRAAGGGGDPDTAAAAKQILGALAEVKQRLAETEEKLAAAEKAREDAEADRANAEAERDDAERRAAAGGAKVDVSDLKGQALDAKLEELGLSKDGTAGEKRARVADALAERGAAR